MKTEPSVARSRGDEQIIAHALGEVRTFLDELKNGTRKYKTIASLGGQVAEAYRGRCVLELLQNAHDALPEAPGDDPGLITFSLETAPNPVLLVANSGHAFELKNFRGLCRLGQSPKDPNKSVGNKGLGFRSVLEVASSPEIWSTVAGEERAAFVFRFDPAICGEVAAAIAALNDRGLAATISVRFIVAAGRLDRGSAQAISRLLIARGVRTVPVRQDDFCLRTIFRCRSKNHLRRSMTCCAPVTSLSFACHWTADEEGPWRKQATR